MEGPWPPCWINPTHFYNREGFILIRPWILAATQTTGFGYPAKQDPLLDYLRPHGPVPGGVGPLGPLDWTPSSPSLGPQGPKGDMTTLRVAVVLDYKI